MEKGFADLFDSECEETRFDNNNCVEQVSTKKQNALTECGYIWEGAKTGCSNSAEAAR
jgi:hypothetical protein